MSIAPIGGLGDVLFHRFGVGVVAKCSPGPFHLKKLKEKKMAGKKKPKPGKPKPGC